MFTVKVTVQNAKLKKYVGDYVTRMCKEEIDKQLEYVTELTVADFIARKFDTHLASHPELQQQIGQMVRAHLLKKEREHAKIKQAGTGNKSGVQQAPRRAGQTSGGKPRKAAGSGRRHGT